MIKKLNVAIDFGEGQQTVGRLVQEGRSLFFQYSPRYLETGHNLSPLKLAWDGELQRADVGIFDGLHGVFADSLPDGWGRLLLDRQLLKQGLRMNDIGPLDRLAYVGQGGRGAQPDGEWGRAVARVGTASRPGPTL